MTNDDYNTMMAKIRADAETAMASLEKVIAGIDSLSGGAALSAPPPHMQKRLKLLFEVKKEGGIVSRQKLHELGASLGYDNRGLGGLFQGSASLANLAGDKVALTKDAEDRLNTYKDWLEGSSD
jgi:hypothetical protein